MTIKPTTLLFALAAIGCVCVPNTASAATCESLKNLMLPNVTIETAASVAEGPFEVPGGRGGGRGDAQPPAIMPAHCRVVAVLTPSSDSHIVVELWMPPME